MVAVRYVRGIEIICSNGAFWVRSERWILLKLLNRWWFHINATPNSSGVVESIVKHDTTKPLVHFEMGFCVDQINIVAIRPIDYSNLEVAFFFHSY